MLHTKYQGSRASDFRQEVLSFLLGLATSDKKNKVSPILTKKNWLRHLAVIFLKQSNNLNNIG